MITRYKLWDLTLVAVYASEFAEEMIPTSKLGKGGCKSDRRSNPGTAGWTNPQFLR